MNLLPNKHIDHILILLYLIMAVLTPVLVPMIILNRNSIAL